MISEYKVSFTERMLATKYTLKKSDNDGYYKFYN